MRWALRSALFPVEFMLKEHQNIQRTTVHAYTREDLLEQHKPEFKGNGVRALRTEIPKPEKSILKFENWYKQMKAPFVIFDDFQI